MEAVAVAAVVAEEVAAAAAAAEVAPAADTKLSKSFTYKNLV